MIFPGETKDEKQQPELENIMMDDDELNLLSDDDVAKLKLMTVTAEENKGFSKE